MINSLLTDLNKKVTMQFIIISGHSGSGKSVALRALEDMGYYCIDNLPLSLLPQIATILEKNQRAVAFSLDIRNLPANSSELKTILTQIPAFISVKTIFLDTDRSTLIRRYSDSRRLHPLSRRDLSLEAAIDLEREELEPLAQHADFIINTSTLSTHELAMRLRELLLGDTNKKLNITFLSFGFKYGIPLDADYVFDVRFLPNPHWNTNLREMTGLDEPVIDFLNQHNEVHSFLYLTRNYIETWLPLLEKNNRSYLTIAIGCTGGKHRSVYIAQQLGEYFQAKRNNVSIRHKTLEKRNSS